MNSKLMALMMKHTITCKEVEEVLMDYLDGRLDFWTRIIFKFHLLVCPDCSKFIREYQNTIALGKSVFENPDDEAVDKVPDDLLIAIMSIKKDKKDN